MQVKERPTFRILEGYEPEVDYEEFKKDFLNPFFLVKDLRKKYNISENVYKEYRDRVLDETGLWRKPSHAHQRCLDGIVLTRECKSAKYIQEVSNGFVIAKRKNYIVKLYGRYEDYETAKKVRDILIENDWDEEVGKELKSLYGLKKLRPAMERAKKVYDEYETRYFFDREHTLAEIKEELGIKGRTYEYLLRMLKYKHGSNVNRRMYD